MIAFTTATSSTINKIYTPDHAIKRILAFDPGSTMMGWCVIDYDNTLHRFNILHHETITGTQLLKQRKTMQAKFTKSFIVLDVYYDIFCQLITTYQPNYIVTEGAFYHRFVQAYASLTLVIHTLRRACWVLQCDNIHEVAPMETKKTITGNSMADKTLIKTCILAMPEIDNLTDVDDISEHEFDAIAHGITFIRKHLV